MAENSVNEHGEFEGFLGTMCPIRDAQCSDDCAWCHVEYEVSDDFEMVKITHCAVQMIPWLISNMFVMTDDLDDDGYTFGSDDE